MKMIRTLSHTQIFDIQNQQNKLSVLIEESQDIYHLNLHANQFVPGSKFE